MPSNGKVFEDIRFDLCNIGDFKNNTITGFPDLAPFMRAYREDGVLSAVSGLKDKLIPETRGKLDHLLSADQAYIYCLQGSMVCKAMYNIGVVNELNQNS